MFSKSKTKNSDELDVRQKELFEHAQARINEKKGLYRHFILFLVGCLFMILLNLVLNFGSDFKILGQDWFVLGILFWSFFILVHIFRVVLFSKFMGKAWKAKQMQYLVEKQKDKITKMEQKLDLQVPEETTTKKQIILDNTDTQKLK